MTQSIKLQSTEINNSYWNNSGAYQKEYSKLYGELVPLKGKAETVHGELIRSASRLFHEYCNNGNCNAAVMEIEEYECECDCDGDEECEICGGLGFYMEEEFGDVTISPFFQYFIDYIRKTVCDLGNMDEYLNNIEKVICLGCDGEGQDYFKGANMKAYNNMTDCVMWYVLNSENTPLEK